MLDRRSVVTATVAVVTGLLLCGPAALAEPKPTIRELGARLERLQLQAERASERYNETREQLASQREQLDAAHTRVVEQQRELRRIRDALGKLAAEQYREGELSALGFVFGDSPQDYLTTAGLASTLAGRSADTASRLQAAQGQLREDETRAKQQAKALAKANAKLEQDKDQVLASLAEVQDQLDSLRADQREAIERAQQSPGGGSSVPVGTSCADVDITAPNARARTAIDFACDQLGEPYQWAGAGPDSWDCSGLTMRAWGAAGVSLPHSSAQQATHGTSVSLGTLLPGDLVFRHSPISHVGLYIGDGLMIHAPQSGDVVRIAPIKNLTAATRL